MLKGVFDLPREERKRFAARAWLAGVSSGLFMQSALLGLIVLDPATPPKTWGVRLTPFFSLIFGEGVFSLTCGIMALHMAYRLNHWSAKSVFSAILATLIGLMMIGAILRGFFDEAC